MRVFLISPFSAKVPLGSNPKDYPYWQQLVDIIVSKGHRVIQIGVEEEVRFNKTTCMFNYSLKFLEKMVGAVDSWISIDNFFVHLATPIKPGIVLYGPSNPKLFGYEQNQNLYISEGLFRKNQYDVWTNDKYNPENFVRPEEIINALQKNNQI